MGPQSVYHFAKNRPYTPVDAPKEKLFALHALLGIERAVVVQAACHGFDNTAVADAIGEKRGLYAGIALLPTTTRREEIRRLDRIGFRGVRFNFMRHLGNSPSVEDMISLVTQLGEFGWHVQIHIESDLIQQMGPTLKQLPVPVVIDHMGRIDAGLGIEQPAFRAMLELMKCEKMWVKLSGLELSSRSGTPYDDAIPYARKLIAEFGDRTLWGTNWPHPNFVGVSPDDGDLVDLLDEIAPSESRRKALLVENPQRLFRFANVA